LAEISLPADFFEQLTFAELFAENNRVDKAVLLIQLYEHIENDLVICLKERIAIDDLNRLANDFLFEHHRGEQAHLALDRRRGKAIELPGDGRIDELIHGEFPSLARRTGAHKIQSSMTRTSN